jgi:hypothetical protein
MWASKESFFAITRCVSGRILGAVPGSSMATPTATCPMNYVSPMQFEQDWTDAVEKIAA